MTIEGTFIPDCNKASAYKQIELYKMRVETTATSSQMWFQALNRYKAACKIWELLGLELPDHLKLIPYKKAPRLAGGPVRAQKNISDFNISLKGE